MDIYLFSYGKLEGKHGMASSTTAIYSKVFRDTFQELCKQMACA